MYNKWYTKNKHYASHLKSYISRKPKKYLDLALQERVIIKRKNVYLELVPRGDTIPENPSPSLDPWFDNPKNIELLNQSIGQVEKGHTITLSKELQQKLLGL